MSVASPIGIYMVMVMTFLVGLGSGYCLSRLTFKIRSYLSLPIVVAVALIFIPTLFNFFLLGIVLGIPIGILVQIKDLLKYGAILLIICLCMGLSAFTRLFPRFPPLVLLIPTIWFTPFITLIIARVRVDQKAKLKESD